MLQGQSGAAELEPECFRASIPHGMRALGNSEQDNLREVVWLGAAREANQREFVPALRGWLHWPDAPLAFYDFPAKDWKHLRRRMCPTRVFWISGRFFSWQGGGNHGSVDRAWLWNSLVRGATLCVRG